MSQNTEAAIEDINKVIDSLTLLPEGMTVEPYGLPEYRVEFHMYAMTMMRRRDYVIQFEAEHGMTAAKLTPHINCPSQNDNAKFFDWIAKNFWNLSPQYIRLMSDNFQ